MSTSAFSQIGLCWAILAVNFGIAHNAGAGGLVAAWGDNGNGQASPPQGLAEVKAIASDGFHSLALRADGKVIAWGDNMFGQSSVPDGLPRIRAIGAGYMHSLAVTQNGKVVAWGNNGNGQTNVPAELSGVIAVAGGYFHSLALKSDGRVVAWGDNSSGQRTVPAEAVNVMAIAASELNSAALRSDGRVIAWGDNTYGQTNIPPSLTNAIAISAGERFFAALKADGTVTAWGWGENGQLEVPPGLTNVIAIQCGSMHTLALKADGTLVSWGYRGHSVVRIPTALTNVTAIAAGATHNVVIVSNPVESPIGQIRIITAPESQSAWVGSNVTFIVLASSDEPLSYQWFRSGSPVIDGDRVSGATSASLTIHGVALTDDGPYTVVVSNAFSVAASDARLTVLGAPVILYQSGNVTVKAGTYLSLTVSAEGTPPISFQWSFEGSPLAGKTNTFLTLGDVQPADSGAYTLRVTNLYGSDEATIKLTVTNSAPYIVQQAYINTFDQRLATNVIVPLGSSATINFSARGSLPMHYQWRLNGNELPGGTNALLSLANLQIDQSGYYSVEAWNDLGKVISAKVILNVSPVVPWGIPFEGTTNFPLGLSNIVAIAGGGWDILALRDNGTVQTILAQPQYVQEWPGPLTNIPPSATNLIAVSAGRDHNLGLRANGSVVAWGGNSYGQTNVPAGLSNVIAIAAGWNHSLALRSNGTVAAWGLSLQPTSFLASLSNIVAVAAGSSHDLALRQDGTVVSWGLPGSPTNVPPGLSNVIAIAASPVHNLALKGDGTVVAWSNKLVTGTNVPTSLSNVVSIAASPGYSLALKADGTIVEWGSVGRKQVPAFSNVVAVAAGGANLTFGTALIGTGAPVFTVQPWSQTVTRGETVQIHAPAVGLQPIKYQWQVDSVDIPGATNASLILTNIQGRNLGTYQVRAMNALGSAVSRTATITIPYSIDLPSSLNAENLPWVTNYPGFTSWFAQIRETHDGDAAAQSGVIKDGGQSLLQTVVNGPGTLSFWWKVSSEEGYDFLRFYLDSAPVPYTSISGETDWQRLTITLGGGAHLLRWVYSKDYSVSSGLDAGWLDEVSFAAPLPVIIRDPSSQTAFAGVKVAFCASASSPSPMTFQWLKDGLAIPGATTPCLTLPSVTRRDSADYALRISNAGGSVTTSNATLEVIVLQRLGALQLLGDGTVQLRSGDSDGGKLLPEDLSRFEAEASENLRDWHTLSGVLTVTNGSLLLSERPDANLPRRFYRILEH